MNRRELIGLAGSAAITLPLTHPLRALAQARPDHLAMMTWGGLWGNGMARYVDTPFAAKTGVKIVQDTGSSPVERVTKLKISLGDQIFDLVQLHDGVVPLAQAQGVLEDLDPNSPNLPFLAAVPDRYKRRGWVAMISSTLGIAYNPKMVKTPPKSFADLWSPDYKGALVLPEITHSIGPYMIPIGAMAAGKDPKDAATGFEMLKKMSALDPIWAKDTDTIMSALAKGEAAAGLLYKSQTYTVLQQGGAIEWVLPTEGGISYLSGTGIAKNTRNRALAEQYLNMTLDPATQGWVATVFNYAGTHPGTMATLSPELQKRVQFTPEEQARIIDLDQEFISARRSEWTDQWNRIVAG